MKVNNEQKSVGLTFEARQKGGLARAENYDGWPDRTGNYGEALKNSGRRFDEDGMEIKFRQVKIEYLK